MNFVVDAMRENSMTDQRQLAEAFWQMNRAAPQINEIFNRNPALRKICSRFFRAL
jgi:hypothetical protein